MKKIELCVVGLLAFIILFIFRPYLFEHKILFPSNLLVTLYAPWKYEPTPQYPHGPPNKPLGFDDIRQFYPNRKLLSESFFKRVIPLWNPYLYSGVPFMASFDTSVWYPLSWIAACMPTVDGWNFLVIVQPVLCLYFMYLFLKSLRLDSRICAYGAFVYAFSGWMVVYWQEILVLEHSFLWLPLVLYASNRLWERDSDVLGFLLLVMGLAISVFGGFLQMSIYVYLVVILWNAYMSVERKKVNMRILTAVIFSIFIAGIQLVPSVQAFLLSPRGANDGSFVFQNGLLPFRHIVTLFAPDYWGNPATYNYFGGNGFYFEKMIFIGIIPLLFFVYGMIKEKQKTAVFWTVLGLATFSMCFALPTSWLPYYLHLPVLSSSYPTRIFAVSAFSFSILSCFGLKKFLHDPDQKIIMYILAIFSLILGISWIVALKFHTSVSVRNLIVPTVFLVSGWGLVLIARYSKKTIFIFTCLLTVASSLYFAQKYVYFGESRFVYPSLPVITKLSELAGFDRVWGYGNAFIEKDLPQYFHWFSTDGYGHLSSERYAQLLSTIANSGKLGGLVRRSDTDLYEASELEPFGSANPYRLRMMSLFGVKYVLETKKGELKDKLSTDIRFPSSEFKLIWEDATWRIWEYTKALPRVLFATNYIVKTKPQDIITALYDTNINLSNTVILEKNPEVLLTQLTSSGQATILSYDLNSVTIRTNSSAPGFLLLTDNYYPGWHATVDDKPANIYRADFTLRAVPVPNGTHTVVFTYRPVAFVIGIMLTLFGILLVVSMCGIISDKK